MMLRDPHKEDIVVGCDNVETRRLTKHCVGQQTYPSLPKQDHISDLRIDEIGFVVYVLYL